MEETGLFRFQPPNHHHHHHLDPSAQEFFPTPPLLPPPPPLFYPYPTLQPPPPPLLLPQQQYHHPPPFCDYSPTHLTFVSTGPVEPQLAPPPPPPSPLVVTRPYIPPPILIPSRALLLTQVPHDVSESTIRRDLEVFGDVRAVQMDRVHDGIVTVHFYDLRHAQTALVVIQEQHMQHQARVGRHYEVVMSQNCCPLSPPPPPPAARGLVSGRVVWAQFTFPLISKIPDGTNQGTLVIFNLDPLVSSTTLQHIFQDFGQVRELRDTPSKKHQRFVEFYDTRDAANALTEMKGREINGTKILIEFSRPGGFSKRFTKSNKNHQSNCYTPSSPRPPPPLFSSSGSMSRTLSVSRNHTNVNYGGSIQDSMASLCIDNNVKNGHGESCKMKSTTRKCLKKGNNCNNASSGGCSSSSTKQAKIRPWKSLRQAKEYDPRFLINEDAIVESSNCKDSRTTVMIKNIPNKYSQKLLLNMLDNHCISCNDQIADGDDQPLSSYDFVYLPIDFINKCNVGYGFVNMTTPEATLRLYKAFHHGTWEVFNSRKICEVTYARLQGVEALRDHFKNSKFPCEADEYMPVEFSPPRDGRRLTEPVPIVGRNCNNLLSQNVVSSSSAVSLSLDISETSYEDNINEDGQEESIDGTEEQVIYGGSLNGGDSGDYYDNIADDVENIREQEGQI